MGQGIELADFIRYLRQQVVEATREGEGSEVRFAVDSMEVELVTSVERSKEYEGGMKVWVANLGGKGKKSGQVLQKIKLTVHPENADGSSTKLRRGASQA